MSATNSPAGSPSTGSTADGTPALPAETFPDGVPAPLTARFTREQLVRYAGASGDFNPIHYSDHFATALGMDSVIAHGMLTMGVATRLVTDWCGDPALVRNCQFRFSKPVPVPDDADGAEVLFTAQPADGVDRSAGSIILDLVATLHGPEGDKIVVGKGKAEVLTRALDHSNTQDHSSNDSNARAAE